MKLNDGDTITVAERDFVFQLLSDDGTVISPNTVNSTETDSEGMGIYSIFCGSPVNKNDQSNSDNNKKEENSSCLIA